MRQSAPSATLHKKDGYTYLKRKKGGRRFLLMPTRAGVSTPPAQMSNHSSFQDLQEQLATTKQAQEHMDSHEDHGHSHQHLHSHGGHDHTHGLAKNGLRLAFFLTILILLAELIGGVLSSSLALLSDAGHAVTDIFALGLAWFAAAQAERPADASKTFGYHRVGILAALLNAVSLIVIALVILWEAVQRFQHPEPIQPFYMFLTSAIGITINLYIGFGLRREGHNLNTRAAMLHVFGDVGASAAVIVAALTILLTGWTVVDPILSVGVAFLIAIGAVRVLRETTDILLEAVPRGVSVPQLVADMRKTTGVRDVHDLHVWSISGEMSALSCHVLIDDLRPSDSDSILRSLNILLIEKYQIAHSTIQFECKNGRCSMEKLHCQLQRAGSPDCQHEPA